MRQVLFTLFRGALLGVVLLVGCVPARVPPQIPSFGSTPTVANPFTITEDVYMNGVFRVNYPAGWRVITSETPFTVTFAAPEDIAIIIVSIQPINTPELPDIATTFQNSREIDVPRVYVVLVGDAAQRDSLQPVFERVVVSVSRP